MAVRFLDGSEEEIVVLWWYKDKVDVKVYDQELQPLVSIPIALKVFYQPYLKGGG